MKKCRNMAFASGLLLMLGACSDNGNEPITDGDIIDDSVPNKERVDIVLSRAEADVVSASNAGAFTMMRYFNEHSQEPNFMLSPLSAQMAMGMLTNGAAGNTLTQLLAAYGSCSLADINSLNGKLQTELPAADNRTAMRLANSAWIDKELRVLPAYSSVLADAYKASSQTLELSTVSAMNAINAWCADKTDGMIPKFLNSPLPKKSRMVLLNALYFKGRWANPFKEADTKQKAFTNADGSKSTVAMMVKSEYGRYQKCDGYELARLTYGNGTYGMTILLPAEGKSLKEAFASLDNGAWNNWGKAKRCVINIELPKFTVSTNEELTPYYRSLGVTDIFDDKKADMSAMSPDSLYVSLIKQLTKIEVDEQGTVAAAVTGGLVDAASPEPTSAKFIVDRPFVFFIDEVSTNTILFAGRVNRL